jgi:phosphocarrier protein HPr
MSGAGSEGGDADGTGASNSDVANAGGGESDENKAVVVCRVVQIVNRRGLHARAAARFVTMAERFGASVDVVRDGQAVSARSIMGLMMLGAGQGSSIELRAEGWDAKEALDALASLVESGFDEHD